MTIGPGTRIGVYEIVSPLGAGGMGEVFRARDTRLNREVALKVLPEFFAADPERLARFEREAQALAALRHPHIATIHGIEEHDGVRALILELVPGESLAEHLARGPLPIPEALNIAQQIADALDAAHERGVIHRDLKPANIQLTPDGTVKVLDFGLAKMDGGESGSSSSRQTDVSASPTVLSPTALTAATVLLGTAGYMSPEQARGKPVDKRADIWAFGVVLYEMLTGTRAFPGDSVTEVAGAVIHKEVDLSALPAATPAAMRLVVARCLQKDPHQRFRDIGDVRLALDGVLVAMVPSSDGAIDSSQTRKRYLPMAAAALAAALVTGVVVWRMVQPKPVESPTLQFSVQVPDPRGLVPLIDLSPDGQSIAFVQNGADGTRLWIHSLRTGEARQLSAIGAIRRPAFWSPDGKFIGYWTGGKLGRVAVDGGPPEAIADAKTFIGGSWGRANDIVYATEEGIFKVPASGGAPTKLTVIDKSRGEGAHALPRFLPDGRHFLYLRQSRNTANAGLYVGSTASAPDRQDLARLVATGQGGAYMPGDDPGRGHLLFAREGLLMAQPFDAGRLALSGEAQPIVKERVLVSSDIYASFGVSDTGTLLYLPALMQSGSLVVIDRSGKAAAIRGATNLGRATNPRLSPDGRHIALIVNGDLWVYNAGGTPPIKLSFGGERYSPIWTPDGKRVLFEVDGKTTLFTIPADGSSATAEPAGPEGHFHPHGWTADGQLVAVRLIDGNGDLVRFAPRPDGKPEPIQETPANEGMSASVSPDGKWVAYSSDATGRAEIWVRPLPGPGSPIRVSPDGGFEPVWAKNGRELFYEVAGKIMSVPITVSGAEFSFKPPVELFAAPTSFGITQPPTYDVTADGYFLMVQWADAHPASLKVVLNATRMFGASQGQ